MLTTRKAKRVEEHAVNGNSVLFAIFCNELENAVKNKAYLCEGKKRYPLRLLSIGTNQMIYQVLIT